MTQAIDAHKTTIGALLGRYERRPVVLPPFQRSYSWEKTQVNTFWDDTLSFVGSYKAAPLTASYFMGSIVIIESAEKILLLDGQQRLATSMIAFAALRDVARELDKTKAAMQKGADFARDTQRELLEKDTEPITHSLTLGDLDEPYFLKSIKSDPPAFPESKLRSHVLIKAAYEAGKHRISEQIKGLLYDDALKYLKALSDALAKGVSLIAIVVQNEEDAYDIFETLNDRGLRLSVPDLVLNLLMRRASSPSARDQVRHNWNTMLRQTAKRDISRFLRHMWVSIYGDIKNEGLYSAIKKNLEGGKVTSVDFADHCAEECEAYVALLDLNVTLPPVAMTNLEGIVKYLGISFSPPLLLAGYRCLDDNDFARLLQAMVTTYVRYVLIANQNPIDVESKFYEAAREIRALSASGESSAKQLQTAKDVLKKVAVEDSVLDASAESVLLERSEALWLLTRVADKMQSVTAEIGMDRANLEHIFPQKPGAAWPNRADLEPLLWHLGNLTILGEKLNRQAQNKGFADKSAQHYSKSEITMTKDLLKYAAWDEQSVLQRAKQLGIRIAAVWPKLE